ncbi:hypothetical protein PENTCL1PPCAC_28449 [Pristionchus entomophagus]|uniref:Major facilitator superfamily (MFS) profile domain-containing protein n=1 Tax=Pristionchus entomophagus TaxID=358040 RepID=A0AAV5UGW0_9BILA|nr:hypothetical protein PENTCL1PPCAC_28449 [Pristionchus entomophagus]
MAIAEVIARNRGNRKALLLIVYIALFLDNMLLTTVVPIIPEYLLRISHPNETDLLLKNKVTKSSVHENTRGKRASHWEDDSWGDFNRNEKDQEKTANDNPLVPKIPKTSPHNRRDFRTCRPKTKQVSGGGGGGGNRGMRPVSAPPGKVKEAIPDYDESGERELTEQEKIDRHRILAEENVHVGLMFGSKALVQLIANPWVGPLTNKIGYTMPMFAGFCIMFLSTLVFAFGESFPVLWLARALQGVGSACTSTSGMGMLAQAYPDDLERGSAMGIALGGLALGVLVGPPYGGVLYEWSGKELPFILLALLALADGSMQFLVLQPKVDRGEPEGSTIKQLAKDPYIIVAAGAITIGNLGIAMLEPSLPLWMMESWGASSLERGAAFLPASISYLIGTNIFGPLAHKMGRWLSSMIGLLVIGFCLLAIPSATSVTGLIIPHFCMGFSIGMIDASMFPLMGWLVDLRHVGVYGSIYAIADAAFCFAFALGPFFSGPLVRSVGFPTMLYLIAIINFLYAPLMFLLRNPPSRGETEPALPANAQAVLEDRYEKIEGSSITRADGYQYDY